MSDGDTADAGTPDAVDVDDVQHLADVLAGRRENAEQWAEKADSDVSEAINQGLATAFDEALGMIEPILGVEVDDA